MIQKAHQGTDSNASDKDFLRMLIENRDTMELLLSTIGSIYHENNERQTKKLADAIVSSHEGSGGDKRELQREAATHVKCQNQMISMFRQVYKEILQKLPLHADVLTVPHGDGVRFTVDTNSKISTFVDAHNDKGKLEPCHFLFPGLFVCGCVDVRVASRAHCHELRICFGLVPKSPLDCHNFVYHFVSMNTTWVMQNHWLVQMIPIVFAVGAYYIIYCQCKGLFFNIIPGEVRCFLRWRRSSGNGLERRLFCT